MPQIDLTTLSTEELTTLEQDIKAEKQRRLDAERKALLDQARELAKKHGVSVDTLLIPAGRRRSSAPAKYRNPDNPKQTWSGRGKKPAWVQAHLDAGGTLDDLEPR